MTRFILKRLGSLVLQVLLVVVGIFLLLRILPAKPEDQVVGTMPTEAAREQARHALGVDVPVFSQLRNYFTDHLLHGNLGVSWNTTEPVAKEIGDRFPITLQLIVLAFIVAVAIAVGLGARAAAKPDGKIDRATQVYSLFAGAQPDFWWGLLLIFLFSIKLKLFPVPTGLLSAGVEAPPAITNFILLDALLSGNLRAFFDVLWHLVLPVVTLAFVLTGPLMKMTRESVLAVTTSDHILYARAAGLSERQIRRRRLRNAVAPILTLGGILFGFMLGGAVLVEYVFSLDGLGLYVLNRTLALDYPAVQGAVIVMTAFSLTVYLLIDIIHARIDPRVRLERTRS